MLSFDKITAAGTTAMLKLSEWNWSVQPTWARRMVAAKDISDVFLGNFPPVFFQTCRCPALGRLYSRCRGQCACADTVSLLLSPSRTRFSCRGLLLERAFERCLYRSCQTSTKLGEGFGQNAL